uniref:Retrovirus-related Pol polyprotein from transposon TNT 1-94 n=1 Tax=Tanacetum cinerariifolium TaxID=118510 RepID=A0A6L2KL94_TANCI|nr:hypothetical protein [Tanacetum cinerariifolium]
MGTVRETLAESTEGAPQFGPKRSRVYSGLTSKEKDRYNADIRAINILLQGLPKDIYTLINHYTNAKDIWDNVKMLLEGSELTKEDRESQLYDDFEHFRQHKRVSIHDYYVRFMMAVKLNRGLRDSNYDQLHAYLKQHETHAKENNMMLERFSQPTVDPLALLSNVSNPQHYSPSSSASNQATVQDRIVVVQNVQGLPSRGQGMNPRGGSAAGYGGAQNRVGNVNPGQARPSQAKPVKCYNCIGTGYIARNCTQPKRPQNSEYYKDKMLLMQAQENEVALDAEQLLFLAGGQDNVFDDDAPTAQTMFMANLSSADPVTDKYVKDNEVPVVHSDASFVPTDAFMMIYNDICESHDQSVSNPSRNTVVKNSLTAELATYKEHIELLIKQDQSLQTVHMLCRPKPHSNELNKVAIGYKNPLCLTRAKQVQPALYNGHEIINDNHAPAIVQNSEDTLEIAEITKKKINAKINDPECVTRKLKSDALKERIKVSRPIKASTVKNQVKPQVLAREKHAIDVEPIVPRLRNNKDAHLDYLTHLKESVETICDIVKEAKVVRPLDRSIVSACRYAKHSQELLKYMIGTCPQGSQQRAKQLAYIPPFRKKHVTIAKPSDKSDSTTHRHVVTVKSQQTNVHVPPSIGVNSFPNASESQPKSHVKPNRISSAKGVNKLPVEDQPRTNKQFYDSDLEVAFRKHSCYVRDTDSVELIKGSRRVFGALCYPTNDSEDLGKLQPTADTGIFVGYAPRPAPNFLTPGQISSGLVPNPVPATPYAPPTNQELEILFQPMFDEYLEPPRADRPVLPAQA